jgi:AcrR family transcriptional regulator
MAAKSGAGRPRKDELADRIVDTALELAEEVSWDGVRLHEVADRLGVPLSDISARYRDLDAVANAWFARLREAMLAPYGGDFAHLPARERLYLTIMRWFDAAAGHRRVGGEMIGTKLYPSHPHHWVPLVFNLSRVIHWVREAALLDARGRRRQAEEIGLSLLFLATLAVWLRDESPDQEATRRFLRRRLEAADRLMASVWGGAGGDGPAAPAAGGVPRSAP